MSDRILVVDDERVLQQNIRKYLQLQGHSVDAVGSAEEALALVESVAYDLVITDRRMPGMDGLALIEKLRDRQPTALTLLMTAYASVDSAIAALRHGAADYLLKPIDLGALGTKVERLLAERALSESVRRLRQELHQRAGGDLVGSSSPMVELRSLIARVASTPANVLIEGASGTGKELVARALHQQSKRGDKDIIAVNLAAQPADLVDATLFGHNKGAFTGAQANREGVFRTVRGGTIFLDEVSELPAAVQTKLLRVIENREVLPLGADRPVPVDFRLVAATNRPLHQLVDRGSFRKDLFFRLNVMRIEVPTLQERIDDLPELATHLLAKHAAAMGISPPRLTSSALAKLRDYAWPGNIRELSNVLERGALLADGPWIDIDVLPELKSSGLRAKPPLETELKPALEAFERRHIAGVLVDCDGDKKQAAAQLGVHLATLYRHLERLGLE